MVGNRDYDERENSLLDLKKSMERVLKDINSLNCADKDKVKEEILDISKKLDNIILKHME